MTSFIPVSEDLFPVHELTDDILADAVNDNLIEIVSNELPTQFDLLDQWLSVNHDGILIKELPLAISQMNTLRTALTEFDEDADYLLEMFLEVLEKVIPIYFC